MTQSISVKLTSRRTIPLLIALLTAFALPKPTYAGSGRFQGGDFDFCVSVRFNATAAQLAQVRTAFQNGSQILADATDDQHGFGTVAIVNDSGASNSADYWVHSGAARANAPGEYGVRGHHINMYFDSNFQGNSGADGDAYTVAHEHAHLAYGVKDEYSGPDGDAESAPASAESATLNYSLMDNYFTRGGRGPLGDGTTYTLNEFDVASNFDPDMDTWQFKVHGKSVWEVIDAHPTRAATAPAGLPISAPPPAHVVDFVDGFGGLRAMLLLDRSGSMGIEQRLEFAKLGANQFVFFIEDGDGLGVASFDSSASVNFPLTTVVDESTRTAARTAINFLSLGGATNIGGGLLAALGQITGQADRSCNEIIVLLSDGDHNTGTAPGAVLPTLQEEGVTVFTIGVGSGISTSGQATLQNIANQTGGRFFRVSNAFDLVGLFVRLAAESIGSGVLTQAPEEIASGETKTIPVLVEPDAENAVFAITLADSNDDIVLSLETPSGASITEATATGDPDIDFISGPNSRAFQVFGPEAGTWQMVVSAGTVFTGVFEAIVFADHDGVQLNTSVANDTLVFPEAVQLSAIPLFEGEAVVGAVVTGTVVRPDGSQVSIALHDDGLSQHGDAQPDDGIYSARFDDYRDDGTYTFELKVVNTAGTTFAGEELFAALAPSNERPVPPFTRMASVTAVVTGVPDFLLATVEYGPETINLRSRGRFVTAYIELPEDFSPEDIAVDTVAITAIDGLPIFPIPAQTHPTEVDDFDNDDILDLMVKFDRQALQEVLSPGMQEIQLEGFVAGELFIGERGVGVIQPGRIR